MWEDITEGAIKNASQLRKALKDIIPQDAEFKENFINATVSKGNLARYYLRAIENTNRKNTNPELLVNSNPEEVNLEHILSKTYNAVNWPNFTEDQHSSFYKRIGNLTLTTTQLNSEELKDKPFGDKKKYYDNSELWITKMITDKYNDWTTDTIKERQKELAEIAVETWSLKF
ncbi:MAG: HNH endonuclease [Nitrospinae bacterium]|nr:HNH endonuclease [Nitrospinota bacterium]